MIRTKLLTNDFSYAEPIIKYVNNNFSDKVCFELEQVDLVELSKRAAAMHTSVFYDFVDDSDIYLVDIVLFDFLRKSLPLERTIVLRHESDMDKITDVRVMKKYMKPGDMVAQVESVYNALSQKQDINNRIKNQIADQVKIQIDKNEVYRKMDGEELRGVIASLVDDEISRLSENDRTTAADLRDSILQKTYGDIRGLGILDSLLADETITEIMVNRYDSIFVERFGRVEKLRESFESEAQYENIIQKIVADNNKEVNQSTPIQDAMLSDGSRVNVVLNTLALNGSTMTIRKFSKEPMTMERLIELGALTDEVAEVLKTLVKARYNIFISGGTSSGKTTFLNALSNFIPRNERIITIEDSAELKIEGIDNLVSMQTKNANAAGRGEVCMRELIKASLRMRPDRIIVGEVRGEEALDMLQAMNTGHDGSLSTGHANSSEDMLYRLETMILQSSDSIPLGALRRQMASSLDIIVHLSRMMDHSRKVLEISEILGVDSAGNIELSPLYIFDEGRLKRTDNKLHSTYKLKQAGLKIEELEGNDE